VNWTDIKVGQQWRSRDKRDHGLIRVVVEAPTGQTGYVVMERSSRKSRLRPNTLLSRYSLIAPDDTEAMASKYGPEPVCAGGRCGERAYCEEAGACLAKSSIPTAVTSEENHDA
jgi:hypothetical protein